MAVDKTTQEYLESNMEVLRDDIINSGMSVQEYVKKHALEINDGKAIMAYDDLTIWIEGNIIYGSWSDGHINVKFARSIFNSFKEVK